MGAFSTLFLGNFLITALPSNGSKTKSVLWNLILGLKARIGRSLQVGQQHQITALSAQRVFVSRAAKDWNRPLDVITTNGSKVQIATFAKLTPQMP
ncbi:hypothetical protein EBB79_08955 [Parasedimentitalea marina]|uniref:Uncharacterized protein n=1 Tax=Parasedimentitalea marina TaxID=2483033 RepID=A0A3T0N1Y8_9RHOB|nr:hypothetical protein EBB79_08955 [Parasedimentitalea marina]